MSEGTGQVDPTRLSVEQAAKLLSAAYRERIEPAKIRLDVQNGAPVNVDGTINLVHYSAWQAKEMGRGE
jgi:hypothetical protein